MKLPGFTAEASVYKTKKNYYSNNSTTQQTSEVSLAWNCDSNCKWYQPDCYLWKEANCNETLACTPWWGHPYMLHLTLAMTSQKTALKNDFGITDVESCKRVANTATLGVLSALGIPAALVSGTMLQCACYRVY